MEVEFLSNMKYSLFVSTAEWNEWHTELSRFWNFFDQATNPPTTPTNSITPAFPSPPTSTHSSNSYMSSVPVSGHAQHYSPHSQTQIPSPYGLAALAQPSTIGTPLSTPALRPDSRKRPSEDTSHEPPPKRLTRSALAHVASLAPVYVPGIPQHQISRLPTPNLAISPSDAVTANYAPSVPPLLPLPSARAMATVFPRPMAMSGSAYDMASPSQSQPTPNTVQNPPNINISPFVGPIRHGHVSPPHLPALPAATGYPPPNQSHLSPSIFLTQRSSPYRPVRQFSTLLVPPSPSSVQNPPVNINHGQLHYQPLGKRNEFRPGVVPYMPQEAGSQTQVPLGTWTPTGQSHFRPG